MYATPGSSAASDQGCTCPVEKNNSGYEPPIAGGGWYINPDCTYHSSSQEPTGTTQ
jgi:hypothetical protein